MPILGSDIHSIRECRPTCALAGYRYKIIQLLRSSSKIFSEVRVGDGGREERGFDGIQTDRPYQTV